MPGILDSAGPLRTRVSARRRSAFWGSDTMCVRNVYFEAQYPAILSYRVENPPARHFPSRSASGKSLFRPPRPRLDRCLRQMHRSRHGAGPFSLLAPRLPVPIPCSPNRLPILRRGFHTSSTVCSSSHSAHKCSRSGWLPKWRRSNWYAPSPSTSVFAGGETSRLHYIRSRDPGTPAEWCQSPAQCRLAARRSGRREHLLDAHRLHLLHEVRPEDPGRAVDNVAPSPT
jgi:hypothetical protein